MNNSNDFMTNRYEDKIQSLRQGRWTEQELRFNGSAQNNGSPLAQIRSAISSWVSGSKSRELDQS